MTRLRAIAAFTICASISLAAFAAFAQRLDPRSPQTLVVGPPRGSSPTARGDGARRGMARTLPASPKIAWRKVVENKPTDKAIVVPPLVRETGAIVLATSSGELIELEPSGTERYRLALGTDAPASASLLSDDAVLVATAARELLVVRSGAVAFRRRYSEDRDGGERRLDSDRGASSTLPLDDGGAVIAWDDQLVAVDRDGNLRGRASMPASLRGSLVAVADTVLATLTTASIVTWRPGAEVRRVGRFSGPVMGPTARVAAADVAAVVDGQTLTRFDVTRGTSAVLFSAPPGNALGGPAITGNSVVLLSWQGGRTSVIEIDFDGRERRRVQVGTTVASDAGAPPPQPLSEVLVDREGRVAFVTPDGIAGVVDKDGTVRTIGETVCFKGSRRGELPIMLVASANGFLVACGNGIVLSVE